MIGKFFIALLGVATINIITTYLGKCGYGEYTASYEFLAFFSIAADLGLYTIGVREMAKNPEKEEIVIGNILTIRTVLSIVLVITATITAFLLPQYQGSRIQIAVFLAGIAAIFNLFTSTVSSILQVHLKMQYNSLASVIGKFITVGYMVYVVFIWHPTGTDQGFYHLVGAGILGNATMFFITYYYSRKLTRIRYRLDMSFMKDVFVKALPYGIALILNTLYFRIGSVLLSLMVDKQVQVVHQCGGSVNFGEVGIYGVPMRILEAIGIVPLYFMNAVLPVLTSAIYKKDGSHKRIIQYAFDFLVMGSMPIVAGAVVLAYPMIAIIATPEFLSNIPNGFYGSDIVLRILIFASAFSFINSLFGFILVADNRQTKLLARNAIGAVLTILLDLLLIPYFGARGAAFANVITELYVAVASYMIARHYIDFKIHFRNTFKIIFCAIVMGVMVYIGDFYLSPILSRKAVFLLIPFGAVVYGIMLFATRVITKDMLKLLKKEKPSTLPTEI